MSKTKYGIKGISSQFRATLNSLEAYIGQAVRPTKYAHHPSELYRLANFVYKIPTPADGTPEQIVGLFQRKIAAMTTAERRFFVNTAKEKLAGLTTTEKTAVIFKDAHIVPSPPKLVVVKAAKPEKRPATVKAREEALSGFYRTWEWRKLRMVVLKRHGHRCQCCGASTKDIDVGGNPVRIVVDHIKPVRRNWELRLDPDNLQVLCDECNMGKGSWDETDYRENATSH